LILTATGVDSPGFDVVGHGGTAAWGCGTRVPDGRVSRRREGSYTGRIELGRVIRSSTARSLRGNR
jgi:hypothetical protein